jgi:hypothetical protein
MAENVFGDALAAGAILTGFCGTFLSFRIQREAEYHRKPSSQPDSKAGRAAHVSLSHFSASFLILISASVITMIFGTALPLLGLSGGASKWITIKLITAGLFAGLALIVGYFAVELVHYDIRFNKLRSDQEEWKREIPIAIVSFSLALIFFVVVCVAL